ncbi:cytochrome c oxidase assembly protein [Paenibacillus chitinolyticus]|uniref:cytochrome c oxidase assembly protein n=1 Tax=Paenibacillus chitinolyticus TaxID=79263 RepID=UPI002DBBEBC8|nr:cytochrome c oxidase assembly protein [Paenibacillus chitinolyticus]MEC0245544.1 cytochrome c oxidase assembly protein [Paenibacillus chitinolyticus]
MSGHVHHGSGAWPGWLSLLPFLLALLLYVYAAFKSGRSYKPWPLPRYLYAFMGAASAAAAVAGPLAERARTDFAAHMTGHLLLGMLAPLLCTLAAPVTLLLRALPVRAARFVAGVLRHRAFGLLSDPLTASLLNIGGLYVLYLTNVYSLMHHSFILHLVIHAHVFLAGCLFTASMISIDPAPHRKSFVYRAAVLILALAAHGILAKYLYAHPPEGVIAEQAEIGSLIMYYGGDAVDIMLITLFCQQWYKAARPRNADVQGSGRQKSRSS